jgi:hypothetical protein
VYIDKGETNMRISVSGSSEYFLDKFLSKLVLSNLRVGILKNKMVYNSTFFKIMSANLINV